MPLPAVSQTKRSVSPVGHEHQSVLVEVVEDRREEDLEERLEPRVEIEWRSIDEGTHHRTAAEVLVQNRSEQRR